MNAIMQFKVQIFFLLPVLFISNAVGKINKNIPLLVVTWDYQNATQVGWDTVFTNKRSAIDTIEETCKTCERMQCRGTVGFGGNPDENGETTLDAVIMDGVTMDVGGVGGLRDIKDAISVARKVLENTKHSLLVGSLATDFAIKMGFKRESLSTEKSQLMWQKWKENKCQPNFWKNVNPDPRTTCGPFTPTTNDKKHRKLTEKNVSPIEENHDTIGAIAIDSYGNIAAGTSTNGLKFKIPGRAGDSPIAGAGAYADQEVGAAAGTGDGDIMMRFLPSFLAVEQMRNGASPSQATEIAVRRIVKHYPDFSGAVIALNKFGEYGAACNGMPTFPFYVANGRLGQPTAFLVPCITTNMSKNS